MQRVAVAADFTSLPLAEPLEFWLAETGLGADVVFAPYDQVFQALLDDGGTLAGNRHGVNVVLLCRDEWDAAGAGPDGVADDLARAVRACADRTRVPHLVVCCPARPGEGDRATRLDRAERRLADALAADARTRVITQAELLDLYPVADPHDPYGDTTAHLPYTPTMLTALATVIVRAAHAWLTPRPKVLVVDADNTLWDGVAAEDGPGGVRVGPARRALQQFLLDQRAAGRLLCVCSKNHHDDVDAVLRGHPDMLLRAEHLTASRVNWQPKSENLASLAHELNLGLDSFVFLDDNPMECAEVRAAHPGVLTLHLPADPQAAVRFLRGCWPLDHPHVTDDDRDRADRYRQEQQRSAAQEATLSVAHFLATLALEVDVRPAQPADLARAAQLTQRANQFNSTGARRSVAELAALPPGACLVVGVRDRFGDYGQTGVVVAAADGDTLEVDTFLLSCRVLGRGVEHHVLRHLGQLALAGGLRQVALVYAPTARNQPARGFLETLPADRGDRPGGHRYILTAGSAATVTYQPGTHQRHDRPSAPPAQEATAPAAASGVTSGGGAAMAARPSDSDLVSRIATSLATAEQVLAAISARRPAAAATVPTTDPVEATVARLWAELLEFPPTSLEDDFFALGGHSLLAVRFAGRVVDELGVELPADVLFAGELTVAGVAATIREQLLAQTDGEELAALLAELDELSDDEVRRLLGAGR